MGKEPNIVQTDQTITSVSVDLTKMLSITGPLTTKWKDGFRRMLDARLPDLAK
jgi:hypothetical protein